MDPYFQPALLFYLSSGRKVWLRRSIRAAAFAFTTSLGAVTRATNYLPALLKSFELSFFFIQSIQCYLHYLDFPRLHHLLSIIIQFYFTFSLCLPLSLQLFFHPPPIHIIHTAISGISLTCSISTWKSGV